MNFTDQVDSPIGPLRIAVDATGRLLRLDLPPQPPLPFAATPSPARCAHVAQQLRQYFAGERTGFELELAPRGTAFQQRAWQALRAIPFGATRSYAEQARALGNAAAARAVGAANARNPIAIVVPCHRVVGSDGSLTGFAGGLAAKQWLLQHERAVLGRMPGPLATAGAG